MPARLIESLATTAPLEDVFSDQSVLQAMLDFEAALARTEAKLGVIPRSAAAVIRKAAWESLKIYFDQPNIPVRMARIISALAEKKTLSVADMRQVTGASRNTLVRDLSIMKKLGWLEFHGSRKNGYFSLIPASGR